jgi:putative ribosome biogenesis GTPase RsgA
MPVTVIAKRGQTMLDIAVEYLGDSERIDEIATLNSLSIGDDIIAGDLVIIPDIANEKKIIIKVFERRNISPASALETLVLEQNDWDVFYGLFD